MIYSAAARLRIDELASFSKHRIMLTSQHTLFPVHLCVACSRDFFSNAEVLCQSSDVARFDLNTLVHRATVSRAVDAIVITLRLQGRLHGLRYLTHVPGSLPLSYRRLDFLYSVSSKLMNCSRLS